MAYISIDRDSIITSWNDAATELFGWTAQDVVGQSLNMIIPDRLRPEHESAIARANTGAPLKHQGRTIVALGTHRDGVEIAVQLQIEREGDGYRAAVTSMSEPIVVPPESKKFLTPARIALGTAGAIVLGLVGLFVGSQVFSGAEVFDPLGPYPLQRVRNRVEGVQGPALHDGETTTIVGQLCSKESTDVLTTISWQAVGATGTFVTVGLDIPQHRKQGCDRLTFRNPMPQEVVAASVSLRADGQQARWVVTGFEVPVREGKSGPRETFTSEQFVVLP